MSSLHTAHTERGKTANIRRALSALHEHVNFTPVARDADCISGADATQQPGQSELGKSALDDLLGAEVPYAYSCWLKTCVVIPGLNGTGSTGPGVKFTRHPVSDSRLTRYSSPADAPDTVCRTSERDQLAGHRGIALLASARPRPRLPASPPMSH